MLIYLETFLISIAGGYLFYCLHIPLPWLLGSVMAVLVWKTIFKRTVRWNGQLRNVGLVILGYMIGSAFTLETGKEIAAQLPAMILITLILVVFSMIVAYFIARPMGVSLSTAIIGNVPGGLSQMLVLSEEVRDADTTVVAFMQTIRLVTVLFIVPFIVVHGLAHGGTLASATAAPTETAEYGWNVVWFVAATVAGVVVAKLLRFPTHYLLGAVLGTCGLVVSGIPAVPLPSVLVIAAQLFVGIHLGVGMKTGGLQNWRKLVVYSIVSGILIILMSMAASYLIVAFYPMDTISAYLSTAPGGMAEMGLTAALVNANVSAVTAYQLFRILFILFLVPPVLRRWLSKSDKPAASAGVDGG